MNTRLLGTIEVSEIGMGCMGFSESHGNTASRSECIEMIRTAHSLGVTLFDTAEVYGEGDNERLVGEALQPIRDEVVIQTKFNAIEKPFDESKDFFPQVDQRLDESLERLGTDYVDIYMCHRVPENIDVKTIAEAMGKLIRKGKIQAWGLSNASLEQIKSATEITPLAVIENEFSMMQRSPLKDGTLDACRQNGIGFAPYRPLAAGFLSGKYKPGMLYSADDIRRTSTWFTDENLIKNKPVLDLLEALSTKKSATYAQIAISYLMHKYERLVPIPGMYRMKTIIENLKACEIELDLAEIDFIDKTLDELTIYGDCNSDKLVALRKLQVEERKSNA